MTGDSDDDTERRCPWCGGNTLDRDGVDELCTSDGCEYAVQGKHRSVEAGRKPSAD
jgi:hypothetical protein